MSHILHFLLFPRFFFIVHVTPQRSLDLHGGSVLSDGYNRLQSRCHGSPEIMQAIIQPSAFRGLLWISSSRMMRAFTDFHSFWMDSIRWTLYKGSRLITAIRGFSGCSSSSYFTVTWMCCFLKEWTLFYKCIIVRFWARLKVYSQRMLHVKFLYLVYHYLL